MTNYLQRSEFRKRGTAMRAGRDGSARRFQPPEWKWTPIDNDSQTYDNVNNDHSSSLEEPNKEQEKRRSSSDPNAVVVRPQRRRKRKRIPVKHLLNDDASNVNAAGNVHELAISGNPITVLPCSSKQQVEMTGDVRGDGPDYTKEPTPHSQKIRAVNNHFTTRQSTSDERKDVTPNLSVPTVGSASASNNARRQVSPEEVDEGTPSRTVDAGCASSTLTNDHGTNNDDYLIQQLVSSSRNVATSPSCGGEATTFDSDSANQQQTCLGTLEDLMHVHARFNNGPIPEPIIAHLVLEVLQYCCAAGETMHTTATRNWHRSVDVTTTTAHGHCLGLDSFVLVRTSTANKGAKNKTATRTWCLVECTKLDHFSKSNGYKIRQSASSPVDAQAAGMDGDSGTTERWRGFQYDLYSVANIAHLLLSGGRPLTWQRNASSGLIDLPPNNAIYDNLYFRGTLAWQELFQALLNHRRPPSRGNLRTYSLKHACNLLQYLPKEDERERFFDRLMQHMTHERAAAGTSDSLAGHETVRFPVKLIGNPFQDDASDAPDSPVSSLPQHEVIQDGAARHELDLLTNMLKEKDGKLASLSLAKEQELQELRDSCEEQRSIRIAAQLLADERKKQLEETLLQRRQIEKLSIMQRRGFETAMADKDKALANLRNDLRLSEKRMGDELRGTKQRLEDVDRRHCAELMIANERIAELETENAHLMYKLEETENALGVTEIERNQLEEQHKVSLAEAQRHAHSLEAELEQVNKERRSCAQTTSDNKAEVRRKEDIDNMMTQGHSPSGDDETAMLRQRREATPAQVSHVSSISKKEMEYQRREIALLKRIQELEETVKRRPIEDIVTRPPQEVIATSRSSASRRGSPHTTVSNRSRLQQATQFHIPGMSLTAAGCPSSKASSVHSQPSDSSRASNGPTRLVITDPYDSDSPDSDSD